MRTHSNRLFLFSRIYLSPSNVVFQSSSRQELHAKKLCIVKAEGWNNYQCASRHPLFILRLTTLGFYYVRISRNNRLIAVNRIFLLAFISYCPTLYEYVYINLATCIALLSWHAPKPDTRFYSQWRYTYFSLFLTFLFYILFFFFYKGNVFYDVRSNVNIIICGVYMLSTWVRYDTVKNFRKLSLILTKLYCVPSFRYFFEQDMSENI